MNIRFSKKDTLKLKSLFEKVLERNEFAEVELPIGRRLSVSRNRFLKMKKLEKEQFNFALRCEIAGFKLKVMDLVFPGGIRRLLCHRYYGGGKILFWWK